MVESKEYVYKQVGESTIAADVHFDKGATGEQAIALYLHGGSFALGSKSMLSRGYINKLVELGFVVVSADYRLVPTITVFDGPVSDTSDAYNWARSTLPGLLKKEAGIEVNGERIVVWGHSCGGTLALLTGGLPNPPRAILDLFGYVYLQDPGFHTAADNSKLPPIADDLVNQIYKDVPPPSSGPPPMGPNGPNLANYRVAWMFKRMTEGTQLKEAVGDGNYARVDPTTLFSKAGFPPTYIIHGKDDFLVPVGLSQRAHDELKSHGVETRLEVVEGANHGFDVGASPGDDKFLIVQKGFEFLRAKA